MKKIISVLLSLLIFITSIFICNPIAANAADTTNRNYIVCNGYYVRDKGSYQIRLDITLLIKLGRCLPGFIFL